MTKIASPQKQINTPRQTGKECGNVSFKQIKIKIANSFIIQLLAIFLVVPPENEFHF